VFVGEAPGHRIYPGTRWKADYGKKMQWLCCRKRASSTEPTVFVSIIEACTGDKREVLGARLLKAAEGHSSGTVIIEVRRRAGCDLFAVSPSPGRVSVGAHDTMKEISTDARIACVAFDARGSVDDALAVDGEHLSVGGREWKAPVPRLNGRISGFPRGIEADPLIVDVSFDVPRNAVGKLLVIHHRNGSNSAWRIERVESAVGAARRLTLDHRGVEGCGRIAKMSEDGRQLFSDTGFQFAGEGMDTAVHQGAWVTVRDETRQIASILAHDRSEPYLYEVRLLTPFAPATVAPGSRFVWSRIQAGDEVTIQPEAHIR
jgi:hypothetical protein